MKKVQLFFTSLSKAKLISLIIIIVVVVGGVAFGVKSHTKPTIAQQLQAHEWIVMDKDSSSNVGTMTFESKRIILNSNKNNEEKMKIGYTIEKKDKGYVINWGNDVSFNIKQLDKKFIFSPTDETVEKEGTTSGLILSPK